MAINYTYKRQGNGRDSWVRTETNDNGDIIDKYMIYYNPHNTSIDVVVGVEHTLTNKDLIKIIKDIDLLNTAVANLTQKLSEIETMLIIQKVKLTGTGPSVK